MPTISRRVDARKKRSWLGFEDSVKEGGDGGATLGGQRKHLGGGTKTLLKTELYV